MKNIFMFSRKKNPKRLYYPTKSHWYKRPRRKSAVRSSRKLFGSNIRTHFTRFFKNAIYFTITGGILLAIVIFLIFSSYFVVTGIEVERKNFNIDSAAIENQLNKYIGRNILFFPRYRIVHDIRESFPEFIKVNVKKVLPHTLKIELESYSIVANLRAYYILPKIKISPEVSKETPPHLDALENALDTAFSLDGKPVEAEIIEEKEELTPIEQKSLLNRIGQAIFDQEEDLELMTITLHELTQPIEDREQVITEEQMNYLLDTVKYFNNLFEMDVQGVEYLAIARELHLKINNNISIWLAMEKDYKEQLNKLKIIYEPAELNKEEIAYIDLRVREKVIYCPRRSQCN